MTKALTAAAVEKYRANGERRWIKDGTNPALYLVIYESGRKSFTLRFRSRGKIVKIVLGPYDMSGREVEGAPQIGQPLTLAAARTLATEVLRQRAMGADPAGDHKARKRRAQAEAVDKRENTYLAALRDYVKEHTQKKNRNWREAARSLGLDFPKDGVEPQVIRNGLAERWGDKRLNEIDAHLIWQVVDEARRFGAPGLKVRNRGLSDNRARMLFGPVSAFFSWALRERRVQANPCKSLSRPPPAGKRERILRDDEIRLLWRACGEVGEPFGAVFKLLLLTGARLNEIARMTAGELSEDGATWDLPAGRTKNKRAHTVPLPRLAREIIASVPRIESRNSYVFTTTGETAVSGWSRAKRRLDEAMLRLAREERGEEARVEPWRIHDLRRTAVSGMARAGVDVVVAEKAVNHISGTFAGVAGIYQRYEFANEVKAALAAWADLVAGIIERKVLPIRRRT